MNQEVLKTEETPLPPKETGYARQKRRRLEREAAQKVADDADRVHWERIKSIADKRMEVSKELITETLSVLKKLARVKALGGHMIQEAKCVSYYSEKRYDWYWERAFQDLESPQVEVDFRLMLRRNGMGWAFNWLFGDEDIPRFYDKIHEAHSNLFVCRE